MEQKFYICEHCGNIIAKVKDSGVPVMCCGQQMKEIIPGENPTIVATGGNAPVIVRYCRNQIIYDKYLLMEGLQLIYLKNREK